MRVSLDELARTVSTFMTAKPVDPVSSGGNVWDAGSSAQARRAVQDPRSRIEPLHDRALRGWSRDPSPVATGPRDIARGSQGAGDGARTLR
jgi:hypothetical protein